MSDKAEAISCTWDTESGLTRGINKSGRTDEAAKWLLFGQRESAGKSSQKQQTAGPQNRLLYPQDTKNTPDHVHNGINQASGAPDCVCRRLGWISGSKHTCF